MVVIMYHIILKQKGHCILDSLFYFRNWLNYLRMFILWITKSCSPSNCSSYGPGLQCSVDCPLVLILSGVVILFAAYCYINTYAVFKKLGHKHLVWYICKDEDKIKMFSTQKTKEHSINNECWAKWYSLNISQPPNLIYIMCHTQATICSLKLTLRRNRCSLRPDWLGSCSMKFWLG